MNRFLGAIAFAIFFVSCGSTEVLSERRSGDKNARAVELEHFASALNKSPEIKKNEQEENFDLLFEAANAFFDLQNYKEAELLYKKILEDDESGSIVPFCHYNIALIAMKNMDWENAKIHFELAWQQLKKPEDRIDALLNYLESLRKNEEWDAAEVETYMLMKFPPPKLFFNNSIQSEIALRHAEALIMRGKIEEGRNLANYLKTMILRAIPKEDAYYIPELSLAYFVLGRSYEAEFNRIRLDETIETLEEKCKKIIEAQTQFLNSIKIGVLFWSNASAFEVAKIYTDLYREMEEYETPLDLNKEERDVYKCELWKKSSNLLKKSREILVKNIETAKKIKEENEYVEMSFQLIEKINEIYKSKEAECLRKDSEERE